MLSLPVCGVEDALLEIDWLEFVAELPELLLLLLLLLEGDFVESGDHRGVEGEKPYCVE
jgi:hypothetical protein